jgi:hypothetical protein
MERYATWKRYSPEPIAGSFKGSLRKTRREAERLL